MGKSKGKVVVAMSGGVDSSVAAALLLREGYDVMGVFMRLGSPQGVEAQTATADAACETTTAKNKQGCCSVLDAADAHRVAGVLGIPLYVLNFQEDFGRVIDYFVAEYNRGRTPNPCVRCNDWLKFGRLAKYAEAVGADFVASGHYARIGADPATGTPALLRGKDHRKDQSYVLFGMSRTAIAHTLLPIGEFEKHDVREMAREMNLPVYNKPDSQEICFVPNQDYAALVRRRTPDAFRPGDVVDAKGAVVGRHEGHQHFTIGQRKGVGVALGYPVYVVDIDPAQSRVTLGEREALARTSLVADQINLLSDRVSQPVKCTAKIRYNHDPQAAVATRSGDDELIVQFDEPQHAVTPGQAVVLYDGDVVLGGGVDQPRNMTLRRNVLIFHQAALGDFIVTWPLATALSRIFPQSRIIYVTGSDKGKLAERALGVESADIETGWHKLLADMSLPAAPAKLLDGAQTVVSFSGGESDVFADALQRVAPYAKCVRLSTRSAVNCHITESFKAQLAIEPVIGTALEQMLRSFATRGIGKTPDPARARHLVIHPGAGKEANRWPTENYRMLAERAMEKGWSVRVLLGEVERERWSGETIRSFESVAEVSTLSTLLELYDQLSAAGAFVGNDSGPAHLAGMLAMPTIAIFGAADPTVWRPIGPRVSIVRAASLEQVSVDSVLAELPR